MTMTPDQTPPTPPTYEELVKLHNRNVFVRQQMAFDNGQLTAQVHELTAMVQERDHEIAQLQKQAEAWSDVDPGPEPTESPRLDEPAPPPLDGPPPENGDGVTKSAVAGWEPGDDVPEIRDTPDE